MKQPDVIENARKVAATIERLGGIKDNSYTPQAMTGDDGEPCLSIQYDSRTFEITRPTEADFELLSDAPTIYRGFTALDAAAEADRALLKALEGPPIRWETSNDGSTWTATPEGAVLTLKPVADGGRCECSMVRNDPVPGVAAEEKFIAYTVDDGSALLHAVYWSARRAWVLAQFTAARESRNV